ncbi:MAG: hypothetical protein AB7F19_07205 [Candidatus Babeliales bacterium]
MKRLLILIGALIISAQTGAIVYTPQSQNAFNNLLEQNPYAVVHFINYDKVADDKLTELALSEMKDAFGKAAMDPQYLRANIAFIGINSRIVPNLISDIEAKNSLKKGDSASHFSDVFLYNNGSPVKDSTGYLATLTDAFDQSDLGVFIQQYLGDYISYKVQQAQAYQVSQPTTVTTRYVERPVYTYTSRPYYDYDDDYYYYRRRPRLGIGFGWGGGWGWGRRGWGWGPGVGFGIGF